MSTFLPATRSFNGTSSGGKPTWRETSDGILSPTWIDETATERIPIKRNLNKSFMMQESFEKTTQWKLRDIVEDE